MFTVKFWRDAGERAIRTFAQAELALIGADSADLIHIHWAGNLSVAAGAAVLSLLTSIVASGVGSSSSASLITPPPATGDAGGNVPAA